MTENQHRGVEDRAAGEIATSLRKFWLESINHAKAQGDPEPDVVLQMLVVATHAMERCFGPEISARLYTDQAALLLARKAEEDRIIAANAASPRH